MNKNTNNVENLTFKVVHQTAYGRSYMWSYYVYDGKKCILSGGVYASTYPTKESAMVQIKRELKSRLNLDDEQLTTLLNN